MAEKFDISKDFKNSCNDMDCTCQKPSCIEQNSQKVLNNYCKCTNKMCHGIRRTEQGK